jgi:hypothetical protein
LVGLSLRENTRHSNVNRRNRFTELPQWFYLLYCNRNFTDEVCLLNLCRIEDNVYIITTWSSFTIAYSFELLPFLVSTDERRLQNVTESKVFWKQEWLLLRVNKMKTYHVDLYILNSFDVFDGVLFLFIFWKRCLVVPYYIILV